MTLIIFALVIVVTVLAFLIRNMTLDFDITGKLFIFHVHTLKSRPFGFLFCCTGAEQHSKAMWTAALLSPVHLNLDLESLHLIQSL